MSRRYILFSIAGILALAGFSMPAYAEEEAISATESQSQPQSTVLELTPVTKRLALAPGEEKTNTLTLKNTSPEPLSLKIYSTPYSNGDDGESQDFETETTFTQVSRWITLKKEDGTFDKEITLSIKPEETKEITYRISTPDNAPAGGQYATIISEIVPDSSAGDMIQTISRVGMVLYVSVAGETQRAASISDIKTTMIAIGENVGIDFTVSNHGNIDFQTTTLIKVSSLGGKELFENTTISSVLPRNSKTIVSEWGSTPRFGIFRLDYTIDALDIRVEGSRYVLSLTPLLLGFFIVLLALTIVAIFYLIKTRTVDKDDASIIID